VAALAKELNVSADKVKAALDASRPARPAAGSKPPARGTKPDQSALAAALADKLDIDQATVKAALDKVAAARKADETARRTAHVELLEQPREVVQRGLALPRRARREEDQSRPPGRAAPRGGCCNAPRASRATCRPAPTAAGRACRPRS